MNKKRYIVYFTQFSLLQHLRLNTKRIAFARECIFIESGYQRPVWIFNSRHAALNSAFSLPYISLNLHLAKCYRQPNHTPPPARCQGLFSAATRQAAAMAQQQPHPPPAPGRERTSEDAGKPPGSLPTAKNRRKGLTTTQSCDRVKEHRRGHGSESNRVPRRGPTREGWPSFFWPKTRADRPGPACRYIPIRDPAGRSCRRLKCKPPPTPRLFYAPGALRPRKGALHAPSPGLWAFGAGLRRLIPAARPLCLFWAHQPGAAWPNGWRRRGKRHRTPPGSPARPRRAPGSMPLGRAALPACRRPAAPPSVSCGAGPCFAGSQSAPAKVQGRSRQQGCPRRPAPV